MMARSRLHKAATGALEVLCNVGDMVTCLRITLVDKMKLPAAAYSAEVATSATKAGSCGVSCGIL
jgi:hypothetical protein